MKKYRIVKMSRSCPRYEPQVKTLFGWKSLLGEYACWRNDIDECKEIIKNHKKHKQNSDVVWFDKGEDI